MQSLAPLRVPGFGRLLTSYTINELGDSVGVVALALLVYDETGSAVATTALFIAAKFLPALLAPLVTARIDRAPLRRALPAIYLVEAVVFGLLALVAGEFVLALVLALALLDGTLALTGRALTRGGIADLLTAPGVLREGNGLVNIGFAVASVGGAALGGVLVAGVGFEAALLIDAASFAVAAAVVASARTLPEIDVEHAEASMRVRVAEGLRHVRSSPLLRILLAGEALALVFFTLVVPIEVVYARETLGTDAGGFGLLLASWGVGIVVGSAVFVAVRKRSPIALVLGSTSLLGVAYLGMSAVDELWAACALSVVGGAGNGVQWVSVMTLLQERTPEGMQARLAGLLESIGAAMPGVGFIIGGALTSVFSAPTTFAVAGVGVLALVAIGAALFTRFPVGDPVADPGH